jgi:metal-responsive CopG/Arc/MetJ family transcriptional regulator
MTTSKQRIQLELPTDMVATIDRIAGEQLLSRSSWLRRTINNTVKYARWESSLNADVDKPR